MNEQSLAARTAITLVRVYQSGWSSRRPPVCRYTPSCSEYMAQSLAEHGAGRGLLLGLRRISRCHPLHRGGYDPVPPRRGSGTDRGAGSSDPQSLLEQAG
jgi:uncharacterized protein